MNRFEQIPQRIATGAAVFLSAAALAACGGGKSPEADQVKLGEIPNCPTLFKAGEPLSDPSGTSQEIEQAAEDLAGALPRNVTGEPLTSFPNDSGDTFYTFKAAREVFYTKSIHFRSHTYDAFVLDARQNDGDLQTRISDESKQFCKDDNGIHLSPLAGRILGAMEYSGETDLSDANDINAGIGRFVHFDSEVSP